MEIEQIGARHWAVWECCDGIRCIVFEADRASKVIEFCIGENGR